MAYRTHIASRTLPASGAWYTGASDASLPGNWQHAPGAQYITVIVTYTAGTTGGYPKIRPVWTHVASDAAGSRRTARDTTADGSATASAPAITINNYQTVLNLKGLTDGSAEVNSVVLQVPPDAVAVKIECAEVGATGTPGTIIVDIDGGV